MGQHGFARDMEFELESQKEDSIWFVLRSNEETLKKYPYAFVLKLGYRLRKNGVEALWQVENPGQEDLPFSIGGHPAFNCPVKDGIKQTDCWIHLDTDPQIVSTRLEGGLASDVQDIYEVQDGYLPVTEHLFDRDALIIEGQNVKKVSLCDEDKKAYLTVGLDAPLFGLWSPVGKNAPFICIEPWYGRCDPVGYDGELKDRKWGNILAPGAVWKAAFTITV
jgi:galactose mutarotase-like enzyme